MFKMLPLAVILTSQQHSSIPLATANSHAPAPVTSRDANFHGLRPDGPLKTSRSHGSLSSLTNPEKVTHRLPSSTSLKEMKDIQSVSLTAAQEQQGESTVSQYAESETLHVSLDAHHTEAGQSTLPPQLQLRPAEDDTDLPSSTMQTETSAACSREDGFQSGVEEEDDDDAASSGNKTVVEAQDLVASVFELCEQNKVEQALELVRTDLRNVSAPQCR